MLNNILINFLIKLKNAQKIYKKYIYINFNKNILTILNIFLIEGYIKNYFIISNKIIKIDLKYLGWWIKNSFAFNIKIYKKEFFSYKKRNKYFNNSYLHIVSTSLGIMKLQTALKLKKGGKILFHIY